MKIRERLTVSFSVALAFIFLVFGLGVYFFSAQYRTTEFYDRLRDRVLITEKMFLEKESFSPQDYEKIREQFMHTLPDETEEVIPLQPGYEKVFEEKYSAEFLAELIANEAAVFSSGQRQGAGRVFHLAGGNYIVVISAIDDVGNRKMTYLLTIVILGIGVSIVVTMGVSFLLSGWLLKPISEKIRKANSISASTLHERLAVRNEGDELDELAEAFNNLLDRLADAFDAQKSFVTNASHEMRNPLTAILGEAEVALERLRDPAAYIDSLQSIAKEADRLNKLVNNLLQIATISSTDKIIKLEVTQFVKFVAECKEQYDYTTPNNDIVITVKRKREQSPSIRCNRTLLQTAIINLFDNATKFSSSEVDVSLDWDDEMVFLVVQDHGVGIPQEDLPLITQPFHRAANVRHISGSGIGIPLTLKIVEMHGGTLKITSKLGGGTRAEIKLSTVEPSENQLL